MKKLLLLAIPFLLFSCCTKRISPIDGTWRWIAENREVHIHTFDECIGFAIVYKSSNKSATEFGKMTFTSDSTAIINFIDGSKSNFGFNRVNDETIGISLGDEIGFWEMTADKNAYKEDEKEMAFIAAMYAMIGDSDNK